MRRAEGRTETRKRSLLGGHHSEDPLLEASAPSREAESDREKQDQGEWPAGSGQEAGPRAQTDPSISAAV